MSNTMFNAAIEAMRTGQSLPPADKELNLMEEFLKTKECEEATQVFITAWDTFVKTRTK